VNPFNYPVYYPLVQAFVGNQSMQGVVDMVGQVRGNFTNTNLLGGFIDNHDNPRFESYTNDSAVSAISLSSGISKQRLGTRLTNLLIEG